MLRVGRPVAALGLAFLVVRIDLVDVEHGEQPALLVGECDTLALRRRVDGQADGQRPRQAVREPHLVDDALVVVPAHEALERRERAGPDHVEVGDLARGERDALEPLDVGGALIEPIDEVAPMRSNEAGLDQALLVCGDRGHARTGAGISPSSSSFATMTAADSSGSWPSVSTTTSGSSGSSYGSSTPVKPLISPANAFAYRPFTSRRGA